MLYTNTIQLSLANIHREPKLKIIHIHKLSKIMLTPRICSIYRDNSIDSKLETKQNITE